MNRQELAKRLNISRGTLNNWENEKPELIELINKGLAFEEIFQELDTCLGRIKDIAIQSNSSKINSNDKTTVNENILNIRCPYCQKGILRTTKNMVYCDNLSDKKNDTWFEQSSCDFHIPFYQKDFKKILSIIEMRRLLDGDIIENIRGDKLSLDLSNSDYFTKIEFISYSDMDIVEKLEEQEIQRSKK